MTAAAASRRARRTGSNAVPAGRFAVRLQDYDMEHSVDITLPFVPFVGLMLRAPFFGNDFLPVNQVYWIDDSERFDVFLEYDEVLSERFEVRE